MGDSKGDSRRKEENKKQREMKRKNKIGEEKRRKEKNRKEKGREGRGRIEMELVIGSNDGRQSTYEYSCMKFQ